DTRSALFRAGTISYVTPGYSCNIDIELPEGTRQLALIATDGGDGYNLDHADWITPTVYMKNGKSLSLTDLKYSKGEAGWGKIQFNKNLLAATNEFEIVVDDVNQLSGLSQTSLSAALQAGKKRGHEGKYVFTLHAPSRLPLLTNADNRELREKMYKGYASLASSGQYDNRPVINEILKTRAAKAKLLGYPDYATYMTSRVMAGTPQAAQELMKKMWGPTVKKVNEEVAEMQQIVDREGLGFKIQPWDYYYYSEKVRADKYNLNENDLRPYFCVDSVRKGIFTMANRLYGVTFTELPDAPKYNPEVKVYDMRDENGEHVAIFMTDYHPRASKRQGAWASKFKASYVDENGNDIRPINFNVGNFTAPTEDMPSLLTLDEVET
ncbi:MAG: NPCBM/NEW2 domain-containing protein, partial [Muribaculaceae bacterium]|nr:NPCBM/NEW2 domain-containing protein [Muribaculaceae bacterium]